MNPNPEFPQSIPPLDQELGFRLMPLSGLHHGHVRVSDADQVVALVLSSCEILLKNYDIDGKIAYFHKRYGYDILPGGQETPYRWHPVSGPWHDPKEFLEIYKAGIKTIFERMIGQIHGCPYEFPSA